jgi:hypothetical protein
VTSGRHKLVWFVPEDALDATRAAVFAAGGGRIGDYERCSWYAAGTGTFLGGEGTDPAIGERGREERTPELRVETVVPAEKAAEVVAALLEAHPYEKVAFDLYPLLEVEAP